MANEIDWDALPQAEATELLRAGLAWRAKLIERLRTLDQQIVPMFEHEEKRGPGRPRKNELPSTRAAQLEAEMAGEA